MSLFCFSGHVDYVYGVVSEWFCRFERIMPLAMIHARIFYAC